MMSTILDISTFVYQTGTLTIAPGDKTAVFDGAGLSAVAKDGDYLFAGGSLAVIQTVTDDTHVELFTEWAGSAVSAGPYLLLKASLLRYHTALIGYDSASFLALLDGTTVWYAVEGDEPDPSIGEEGQRALKSNVSPWKIWLKVDGAWVLQPGSPGGPGDPGADGATWVVQASEPGTDYPVGSLWLDADSADLDVYSLGGSPLAWTDTGVNLKGAQGNPGLGVPAGGAAGQVLAKASVADNDTEWVDPPAGGGDVAGDTHAATSKTTPANADEFPIVDSEDSNVLKKLTWANLKSALATTFLTPSAVRERLTGNRTYYVSTTGDDSLNNGLSSGAPFLTITKALSVILGTLDVAGFTVTIQLADGTYNVTSIAIGAGVGITSPANLVIRGNNTTPSNVKVSGTDYTFRAETFGAICTILDMQVSSTGGRSFSVGGGGQIYYGNVVFAAANEDITVLSGGYIQAISSYSISANKGCHINVAGGQGRVSGVIVTLTGIPAFSGSFVKAYRGGVLVIFNNTYSGTATGPRFSVYGNGLIDTNGLATTGLPGDSSPTTPYPSGGQYL